MFSAVFSVTLAEGANAEQYVADAKAVAEAVSPVFLADMVLEPAMPGGNFFCEVGFADEAAFKAAKATDAWSARTASSSLSAKGLPRFRKRRIPPAIACCSSACVPAPIRR